MGCATISSLIRLLAVTLLFLFAAAPAFAHDSGFGLARYTPDGQLDRSFGTNGVVITRSTQRSFVANALALQPDGKIVLAGMNSDLSSGSLQLAVARYDADGTPDLGFGSGGLVTTQVGEGGAEASALVVEPDGSLVVAGTAFAHGASDDRFFVARYSAEGALDSTFGSGGFTTTQVGAAASAAAGLVLEPDGHIVAAGTAFSNGATDDDFAVVAYTADGKLDSNFGGGGTGVVTTDFGSGESGPQPSLDRANAIALQSDGKLVVAGFTRGEHQAFAAARYLPNGSLDPDFGVAGKVTVTATEPQVYAIVAQASGELVLAGSAQSVDRSATPFTLLRLHRDGSLDKTFGSGGVVSTSVSGSGSGARAAVAQADGKLITGGAKFGAPSATGDALPDSGFALARYNADGSADAVFGTDGKTTTDLGDAGATPLSLAVQPDGKILAAGLVFFQTQTGGPPQILQLGLRVAAPVLGVAAVLGLIFLLSRRR